MRAGLHIHGRHHRVHRQSNVDVHFPTHQHQNQKLGLRLPLHQHLLHLLGLPRHRQERQDRIQICPGVLDRADAVLHDEFGTAVRQQSHVCLDAAACCQTSSCWSLRWAFMSGAISRRVLKTHCRSLMRRHLRGMMERERKSEAMWRRWMWLLRGLFVLLRFGWIDVFA
jgi:hypothetical protein